MLALRYRAIFDPKQMLERGDLFRGAIEDRYISAFLNAQEQTDAAHARADLVATALEILRVAALSSYENKAISSGVLLVDDDGRDARWRQRAPAASPTSTRPRSPASRASTASATASRRCFSSTATAPCSTSSRWRGM